MMHPAQKAHIYGMLQIIRQGLSSIEASLSQSENEALAARPLAEKKEEAKAENHTDDGYLTPEQDAQIALALGLNGGN